MPDIIRILSDAVANQIAAGEVIQRPSSVVKELMENAVDSGATKINLIVKEAGKTLIQVIDNGCGMSETDARISFERHATSKIRTADDLFAIRTMGFRGEALASIAAIAQVEMKTRKHNTELGTEIHVEATRVVKHDAVACQEGTSIAVKNIFYNLPARRKFLKSDHVETRHIIDEFQRVALVNDDIEFSLYHNNKQVFLLKPGKLKQRIVQIFGNTYNEKLISLDHRTDIISIRGFVGKPQYAKKTRGEQYFFVNKRFFKHPYLHHSVTGAFQELIPDNSFPTYFIYLDVDPNTIDINIHPTKTEVKFEDEKLVYAVLRSSLKQALGQANVTPSIDFDVEQSFDDHFHPDKTIQRPEIKINPNYNPFDTRKIAGSKDYPQRNYTEHDIPAARIIGNKELEFGDGATSVENDVVSAQIPIFQLYRKFIVTTLKSGLLIIDQQRAHERILYEHFLNVLQSKKGDSQQCLYPVTLHFNQGDAEIIRELRKELAYIGFQLSGIGDAIFILNGVPADIPEENAKDYLDGIIENYKKNLSDLKQDKNTNLAKAMARKLAIKAGRVLGREEMQTLIKHLFLCKAPYNSPDGKSSMFNIEEEDLHRKFNA